MGKLSTRCCSDFMPTCLMVTTPVIHHLQTSTYAVYTSYIFGNSTSKQRLARYTDVLTHTLFRIQEISEMSTEASIICSKRGKKKVCPPNGKIRLVSIEKLSFININKGPSSKAEPMGSGWWHFLCRKASAKTNDSLGLWPRLCKVMSRTTFHTAVWNS